MRRGYVIAWLSAATSVLFIGSLAVGPAALPMADLWNDLFHDGGSGAGIIFLQIRLPRALLGLLVGASLGMGGAVLQGWLRNPLAEPAMIGISPCASLGAVIVFYTGWARAAPLALPVGGVVGALVAVVVLLLLAGRGGRVVSVVLAGMALSSLAGALTSLALSLSPNPYALSEIVFWLLGSLADRSLDHVALAAPFIGVGLVLMARLGRSLDALTLGEATARSLGVDLRRLRLGVVVGTALAVGASVAVAGTVGFVGLVVPHLLRPLVGWEPGRLLTPSALGGAALTLAADIAVRCVGTGGALKLGVATALVGAPFFLALVARMRNELP